MTAKHGVTARLCVIAGRFVRTRREMAPDPQVVQLFIENRAIIYYTYKQKHITVWMSLRSLL